MALYSFSFRRTLTTASCLLYRHRPLALSQISSPLQTLAPRSSSPPSPPSFSQFFARHNQSRLFRSSPTSLGPPRSSNNNNDDPEIGPDTILFEGCDYNHWLITIDFPKDRVTSPEEKVQTYVETLAKGLNISIEEAKLKMYACSTSTYDGFQAVMTEDESRKFEGLPGVVFVLPDSYIDPANKAYGGDQYINGTIIPRPPPFQYDRNRNSRSGDRNRVGFDRRPPRMDRQESPMLNQPGNPPLDRPPNFSQQKGYGPSQPNVDPQQPTYGFLDPNYGQPKIDLAPQQQYSQPQQGFAPRQQYGQPQQGFAPKQQYGQPQQGFPPKQQYGQPQQGFVPQQQHGQPQQGFSPQQQHGQPQQGFAPQQQHGQPQQGFAPQQQYGQPQQGFPSQQQYGQPQQGFSPQQQYGQPQQGFAPQQQQYGQPVQRSPPRQQYDPSSQESNYPSKLNYGQTE